MDADAHPTTEDTTPAPPPDAARIAAERARILARLNEARARRRPGDAPIVLSTASLSSCLSPSRKLSLDRLKRTVRERIDELRADGEPILPDAGGVYLAGSAADFTRMEAFLRRNGVAGLRLAARLKALPARADAQGQHALV